LGNFRAARLETRNMQEAALRRILRRKSFVQALATKSGLTPNLWSRIQGVGNEKNPPDRSRAGLSSTVAGAAEAALQSRRVLRRQGLDGGSQAALVASGLVLVDDFLVSDAVDGRHGLLEDGRSSGLVASQDGLADSLDCGTQGRALSRVVSVLLNCLTSALTRLCGICHGIS
jgi:hypothetical protein